MFSWTCGKTYSKHERLQGSCDISFNCTLVSAVFAREMFLSIKKESKRLSTDKIVCRLET
jgi:hypothetical protein